MTLVADEATQQQIQTTAHGAGDLKAADLWVINMKALEYVMSRSRYAN